MQKKSLQVPLPGREISDFFSLTAHESCTVSACPRLLWIPARGSGSNHEPVAHFWLCRVRARAGPRTVTDLTKFSGYAKLWDMFVHCGAVDAHKTFVSETEQRYRQCKNYTNHHASVLFCKCCTKQANVCFFSPYRAAFNLTIQLCSQRFQSVAKTYLP